MSSDGEPTPPPKPKKQATEIEKIYQKKSQLEHILLRPDTYIGSVERNNELQWYFDSTEERMVQKEISYVPGLYKIFDEILVNAADNKQRDPNMDTIKIDIDQEQNLISVWNNGKGIPVVMHKEQKMYVPTMIFGHLLTSSNYNDEEDKVTGGRNGYGAKLCNIFSTKFVVETSSEEYRSAFKQTWGNNMSKVSDPKIKPSSGKDFTKITFSPDLAKFHMDKLDDDIVKLMSRRAYDVAASTRGVKVFLNGKKLPVKDFKSYVELYTKKSEDESGAAVKVVHEICGQRWEVAATTSDKGFQQVSFVNSIATTKGGRHVDHVTDSIIKQLITVLQKKNKGGIQIKPFQVKNHLWVFVNCLIVNPTFDSQTKEHMTLQVKKFGSKCTLTDKFIGAVAKCGIVESVLSWAKFKAQTELSKTSGKKQSKLRGIPKLEDANEAGGKEAKLCTLILTEGDSAKSLVVSGFAVIGRDYYGVFPLRGKLLNVREATHKQILENAEINNIIKIMGLQYKMKYTSPEDLRTLRYGKLMIMTDQDQDGSHIKGLLINFIHHNWPDLLRQEFLEEFITPIVKATRKGRELNFYSLPEFEEWKKQTVSHTMYNIKYYKGLGTSTSNEAKEYFQDMERHKITFKYDGPADDQAIVLAFSKKHVEDRKGWLTDHMVDCRHRKEVGLSERYLYNHDTRSISYAEFINLELILFSNADNVRSIPSVVDGLKPGQRKILYTCIKRNDKREIKVAQLAGSVAEKSAYHHGEVSLCMTIIGLAQNYVGSNNINLLMPNGQFGTRLCGGKDAASPRYIFTMMSPLARLIFHPSDDSLLNYEYDDNLKIEPTYYVPIIPMVLVNGADGIGTGWMTRIPNYNPRELISNIRLMLDGKDPKPMTPWYKNFKGTMESVGERVVCSGEISILDHDTIEISELPVGIWTQNYKENVLEIMLNGNGEKVKPVIQDYKEYNTDTTVRIVVKLSSQQLNTFRKEGLHKAFKLQTTMSTSSMVAFDEKGVLRTYPNVETILREFFTFRLDFYAKRKAALEGMLEAEAQKLSNQARFILEKCERKLIVENKLRHNMIKELIKAGYQPDPVRVWKKTQNLDEADVVQEDAEAPEATDSQNDEDETTTTEKTDEELDREFSRSEDVKNFDYLLGMSMWMLTKEKKDQLLRKRDEKIHEMNILKAKTPSDLWRADLDELSVKIDQVEAKERKDELAAMTKISKKTKTTKGQGSRKGKTKVNLDETLPSTQGERVEPVISEDLFKKIQAATKLKETKSNKKNLSISKDTEEKDEFDKLVEDSTKKSLKDKMAEKKAKDGMKQTKLNFKKEPAKKSKKVKNGFSDDEEEELDEDDEEVIKEIKEVLPARSVSKRTAAAKVKAYNLDDEENSSDSSVGSLKENTAVIENDIPALVMSDSEDEVRIPPKDKPSAEALFDSLLSPDKADEKMEEDEVKAPPTKRKRPAPKAKAFSDSDEDVQPVKTKKKAPAKSAPKKKKGDSSDDDFDFESELKSSKIGASRAGGRARKPTKFNYDDSDDSS